MEKEKIYNTVSKRYLEVGGKQYKKLINSGYIVNNNQLILPNIENQIELNQDVINEIYNNIYDIDTIINICSLNKEVRQMCSQEQFWKPILNYNDIELPSYNYITAKDWIKYIQYQNYIKLKINDILTTKITQYTKVHDATIENLIKKYRPTIFDNEYYNNKDNSQLIIQQSTKNKNRWYIEYYNKNGKITYMTDLPTLKLLLKELIISKYI